MDYHVVGYFRQTIFAFSKIAELSFEKGKSHNAFLIAKIKAILSTLAYDFQPEVDITIAIFQIRILLK